MLKYVKVMSKNVNKTFTRKRVFCPDQFELVAVLES